MTGQSKKFVSIISTFAVIALIFLSGCASQSGNKFTNSTLAMGTVINETVYADSEEDATTVMTDITKLINELDTKHLSWRIKGTDVYTINQRACVGVPASSAAPEISDITYKCIKTCLDVSEKSNGLFDITVGHLSELWGIGTETARVPSDDEIQSILGGIDYKRVLDLDDTISVGEGQKLDLGAVGKGLACDEIRTYLDTAKANGKTTTSGAVISVGGSVLIYGTNPSSEDGSWSIGIRNPFGAADDYAAVLKLGEACVSTSGDYEKVLETNGKKYHHILNPKTGYPAESNITGVTVVSDSGIISDALSTTCFILGYSDEALNILKAYDAEAVFILKDKTVYVTDGLTDKLTLTTDDFKLAEK